MKHFQNLYRKIYFMNLANDVRSLIFLLYNNCSYFVYLVFGRSTGNCSVFLCLLDYYKLPVCVRNKQLRQLINSYECDSNLTYTNSNPAQNFALKHGGSV